MSIFRTINTSIEKPAYNITIANMDCSTDHWGNEKQIFDGLSSTELFFYDQENLNKNWVLLALKIIKANPRIKDLKFYRIKEENKLILLAISEVPKFKEVELFKREMLIDFKKIGSKFSIIEVLSKEIEDWQKEGKTVHENWVLDEYLTDRFNKLKGYQ